MESPSHLWELSGSHWKLPILVTVTGDIAVVHLAGTTLLRKQTLAIIEALSHLAVGGSTGEWHVPLQTLVLMAEESKHEDPEDIVVWRNVPEVSNHFPKFDHVDEFIADWTATSGLFQSTATAATVYSSLMTHMMHWMINKGLPVNLLFGTIYPLLFRRNWKEILWGKVWLNQDERQAWYKRKTDPEEKDIVSGELIAWDEKAETAGWTMEFVSQKWFEKHTKEIEAKRRNRYNNRYAHHLIRQLDRQKAWALEIFKEWATSLREKAFKLPAVHWNCNRALAKSRYYSEGKVIAPYRTMVVPAVVMDPPTPDSLPPEVARAFDVVPEMSRIQPQFVDVRNAGEPVDKPGDGET